MTDAASSASLWKAAWRRLCADKISMASLFVVLAFLVLLLLSAFGFVAADWSDEVGAHYAPPSFIGQTASAGATVSPALVPPQNPRDPLRDVIQAFRERKADAAGKSDATNVAEVADPLADEIAVIRSRLTMPGDRAGAARKPTLPFGADKWGHDIVKKTIKGAETSILVGLTASFLATFLGTLMGACAGYWGGRTDDALNWFYNIFTSIPYLLLILAVAAVLQKKGVITIVLILGLTGWTGVFRLVRAEYIRHKEREYVMAASAIGASHLRRMFSHIFPNISHIPLVQMSILSVGFIKSEVILSFLGFGVPVGVVSWGSMLNEAQNELILGKWWQLVSATAAMAVLVTAFSLFTDGLRDALDPRLRQG